MLFDFRSNNKTKTPPEFSGDVFPFFGKNYFFFFVAFFLGAAFFFVAFFLGAAFFFVAFFFAGMVIDLLSMLGFVSEISWTMSLIALRHANYEHALSITYFFSVK